MRKSRLGISSRIFCVKLGLSEGFSSYVATSPTLKEKGKLACVYRITGGNESYCFLQSNRAIDNISSQKALVFHGVYPSWPVRCDGQMLSVCSFRETSVKIAGKGSLLSCPYCHKRHKGGSTAKRLCEDWHSVKSVLKEMRGCSPPIRYFEEGTTLLPYPTDTPGLVRQLIWPRLKGAVLRRDRFACQECGIQFGRTRRKVYDPEARRGRGGYVWESLEVHHIIPRSRGGSDHPGNLKTLCPECHRRSTKELLMDKKEEKRRELELVRMMGELKEDDFWEPPPDD